MADRTLAADREDEHLAAPAPDTAPSPVSGVSPGDRREPAPSAAPPVPGLTARRLVVGAASDAEEARADAMADRIVAHLESDGTGGTPPSGPGAGDDGQLHRSAAEGPSPAGAIGASGGELGPADDALIASRRGGGSPLPGATKDRLSRAMNADLSHVRLHTGPEARALNERMSALAFTTGSDIFFRDGTPDLSTGAGRRLIAHEVAHAVGPESGVHRLVGDEGKIRNKGKGDKKGGGKKDTGKGDKPKKPGFFDRLFGKKPKPTPTEDSGPDEEPTPKSTKKKTAPKQDEQERLRQEAAEQERLRLEAEEKARQEEARKAQERIDRRTKSYSTIEGMGLPELEKYLGTTADWDKHSSVSADQKELLELLRDFAQEDESGACPYTVGQFMAIPGGAVDTAAMTDQLASMRVYGKAVQNEPFSISQQADIADARSYGAALQKLLDHFPSWVLASAMTEEYFVELIDEGFVDDVIAYYEGSPQQPIFMAEDGADFQAYLQMRLVDNVDPAGYQGGTLAPYVRNFHRFHAEFLDLLEANFNDTSKSKPLTLILHTSLDHNGAFHRDPNLLTVIKAPGNNTLMIEGGETLDDYKSQITPLAQAYGVHDKIDQVMFAGHGNSRSMELAGGIKDDGEGKIEQTGDDIDTVTKAQPGKKTKTEELFDEVLANMDQLSNLKDPKQPHRKILFNACLTNSNVVRTKLTGKDSEARKQIRDWIKDHMSLATYLNDRAQQQGVDVKALGANASINQVELIDSTGALDMVTSADPKVTADKIEYVRYGKEPTGVLRAVIESYGNDAQATVAAMNARLKAGNPKTDTFDDLIVAACFLSFTKMGSGPARLNNLRLVAEMAEEFSHLQSESHGGLAKLRTSLKNGWGDDILDLVIKFSPVVAQPKQGLMIRLARLAITPGDTALRNAFMTALGDPSAGWTAKSVVVDAAEGRFLDIPLLQQANLFPALLTGAATRGKLVLALAGLVSKTPPDECKNYLRGLRRPEVPKVDGLPAVPKVPAVPEQPAPRALVPEVPAVPGRAKVEKIAGQREEVAEVPDLPKLPELPEVPAPVPPVPTGKQSGKSAKQEKKPEPVIAPGRPERPERDEVPEVPKVDPYFEESLKIDELLGGASTVRKILQMLS